MRELTFIRNNFEKWKGVEEAVGHVDSQSPDVLADMYVDLTSDLAFAQSHYPESRITIYLNNLSSELHNLIYRNKREKWSRLLTFWTREVPLTMYEERRVLLASLLVFVASALMGIISQLADADFCRVILGDAYVDMTLDNIAKGDPMAVYGGDNEMESFLKIAFNNISVAFRCFVMGMLTSLGTGLMLFYNGIMVGCFQAFFVQQGLLWESHLAIFLHGTLELTAIVVAGGAGIALGNGFLFPGTLSRLQSFRRGAKRGLKIVVGTVPVFCVAAFVEGFFTRHTEYGDWRLLFIVASFVFIVYYYIYRSYQLGKKKYGKKKD